VRARVPLFSVLLVTLVAALACGSGPSSATDFAVRKSYSPGPGLHDPAARQGQLVVAPDRARLPLAVRVGEPSAQEAADKARAELEQLRVALTDTPPCTLRAHDYEPPSSDGDLWWASMQMEVEVDLTGLTDALARMDRLDACRGVVLAAAAVEAPKGHERSMSVGAHRLIVDDPGSHLSALLSTRGQELAALGAPGALHPEDYRCVPKGVSVTGEAMAGVTLSLDQECRVAATPPKPPAEG
jgi:hypothetical protein